MGYTEATGTGATATLHGILARERVITAVVLGRMNEDIAAIGRRIARESPSTWWVVWVPDPDKLDDTEWLTGGDPDVALVTLDCNDRVTVRMKRDEALLADQFLVAITEAERACG